MRSQPSDPVAFPLVPLLPAALDPYQESDGKRDTQALQGVDKLPSLHIVA
jgi:hypothetical protein